MNDQFDIAATDAPGSGNFFPEYIDCIQASMGQSEARQRGDIRAPPTGQRLEHDAAEALFHGVDRRGPWDANPGNIVLARFAKAGLPDPIHHVNVLMAIYVRKCSWIHAIFGAKLKLAADFTIQRRLENLTAEQYLLYKLAPVPEKTTVSSPWLSDECDVQPDAYAMAF